MKSVRIADIFDIAFVSLFFYGVLTWFKRTASRSVLVGISLLAVVYFAARAYDMYLTALLFHAAFAVLLVALVVVFQEDLRRVFEHVATLGTLHDTLQPGAGLTHLDTLVEVAADLAARRIGGLLVIKGRQSLERHIDGGVAVEGQISKPLLESIFDPHSLGHDGAVIIDNDRVSRFAAHLPLSHNLRELGQRGTRHSAALGLSELTDAVVIVVSEERGRISVAQRGKLIPVQSATELQYLLDQFCRQAFPRQTDSILVRLVRENAALKGVSVALACLAWYLIHGAGTVQRTFVVPIEYRNVPEGLVIEETAPLESRVTLSGFEHAFNLLAPSTLKISLDLAGLREGANDVAIYDDHVKRPPNLAIFGVEPRVIRLEVHSLANVDLPIEVRMVGWLPPRTKLNSLKCTPDTVRVKIWRSQLGTTRRIFTKPIDLSQLTTTVTLKTALDVPSYIRFADGVPPDVRVTAEIGPVTLPPARVPPPVPGSGGIPVPAPPPGTGPPPAGVN